MAVTVCCFGEVYVHVEQMTKRWTSLLGRTFLRGHQRLLLASGGKAGDGITTPQRTVMKRRWAAAAATVCSATTEGTLSEERLH